MYGYNSYRGSNSTFFASLFCRGLDPKERICSVQELILSFRSRLHFRELHLLFMLTEVHAMQYNNTLMCLSFGTPKNNKFSICSKWKIHYFKVSQNQGKLCLIIMRSVIGTLNNHHFPYGTNGKVVVLGVPIFKHFRVFSGKRQGVFIRAGPFIHTRYPETTNMTENTKATEINNSNRE